MLELKEKDILQEKRKVSNLEQETGTLKDELRKAKASGGNTSGVKSNSMSSVGSSSAMSNRRSVNPGALRRAATLTKAPLDTSKWLDDDFAGVKLKNFDEMREGFIEDLTNQFSDLLVPQASRH